MMSLSIEERGISNGTEGFSELRFDVAELDKNIARQTFDESTFSFLPNCLSSAAGQTDGGGVLDVAGGDEEEVDKRKRRADCSICGAAVLKKNMPEHKRRHEQLLSCTICLKTFNLLKDLKAHAELHQSVQVVCPECGIGFKSRAVFRCHRSRVHSAAKLLSANSTKSSCPFCRRSIHPRSLSRHISRAHVTADETPASANEFVCSLCHKKLSDVETLKRHRQLHDVHKRFECTHCGEFYQTKRQLTNHVKRCQAANATASLTLATLGSPLRNVDEFQSLPSPLLVQSPPPSSAPFGAK